MRPRCMQVAEEGGNPWGTLNDVWRTSQAGMEWDCNWHSDAKTVVFSFDDAKSQRSGGDLDLDWNDCACRVGGARVSRGDG